MLSVDDKVVLLHQCIAQDACVDWQTGEIPTCTIANLTSAIQANQYYYDNPEWAKGYFDACHRDEAFKQCWQAAVGRGFPENKMPNRRFRPEGAKAPQSSV
ncbi:hypothetical protein I8748_18585 [Nostoc sp. CENA67]|uniref:Uncharacterized protein n=1 Tax=Amazonocrinis nigriterrae CENA67 TaxID=2794033 RepID=A0A8J7HVF2_9NOST|nr:hypothetical protein [Amazonocrinis nigriterrae]MBH8564170.1 hypothetical protein [Amazonocrinis nigriterrae CENA67]